MFYIDLDTKFCGDTCTLSNPLIAPFVTHLWVTVA